MLRQFSATDISFIGEQDGAHERRLKEAITVLLDLNASVTRAYLAWVRSDDGTSGGVLLGMLRHDQKENGKLALQMDRAFDALLNTEAHLDVVFLDDESEARFRKSCRPFYIYTARYH
jgi:type III secretion system (T3SS) SseB-like protein